MPTNILIIGASRGLGLALAQEFASDPNYHIYASVRSPAPDNRLPANITQVILDITDDTSIHTAASSIPALDILIVNAAFGGDPERLTDVSPERLLEYLQPNVVGVHRVVRAFLPSLRKGEGVKKIILISSYQGSLEGQKHASAEESYSGPYSVSKAAMNMLAVQYHNELNGYTKEVDERRFVVVPIHPGWMATDMGKKGGDGGQDPRISAKGIVGVVNGLKKEDSAVFYQWDGKVLPW
ncbi:hypothetical protein VNI00_010524 [Paramarasmius palmivorus]|uniref:NAD(P)-binding protein n=1 Tax=Paramarasmius palmivorus TaxID=297713 RepID=A0AAW0CJB2_9AGAR